MALVGNIGTRGKLKYGALGDTLNTASRVEGLNKYLGSHVAVSGETAATGQVGYVLAPWQTAEITGWRKSLSEAAAFYFTALPDSYAARTDRPDNVGVIGVAVFREKTPPVVYRAERDRIAANAAAAERKDAPAAPAASGRLFAAPLQEQAPDAVAKSASPLGTGHGRNESSYAQRVNFERALRAGARITRSTARTS